MIRTCFEIGTSGVRSIRRESQVKVRCRPSRSNVSTVHAIEESLYDTWYGRAAALATAIRAALSHSLHPTQPSLELGLELAKRVRTTSPRPTPDRFRVGRSRHGKQESNPSMPTDVKAERSGRITASGQRRRATACSPGTVPAACVAPLAPGSCGMRFRRKNRSTAAAGRQWRWISGGASGRPEGAGITWAA